MAKDFISVIKQLYSSSGVPVAAADENFNIIWKNRLAEAEESLFNSDIVSVLSEKGRLDGGIVCKSADNGTVHRLNVMKFCDGDAVYYIIEHISSDELKDLLKSPDVRNYFAYICARIRESAGAIAVSADEIDSAVMYFANGREDITENLNSIYRNMMLILREVIDPEQVYYALDPYCDDVTICVEDEIKLAGADASRSLGKTAVVDVIPESGIYIRMNRGVFETIIADMTAVCCEGALFPDKIVISSERTAETRAVIRIKSINTSGRKNVPSNYDRYKRSARLYADYLCDVMCSKYGAVFTQRELDDGFEYSMEIDALPQSKRIVMNGDMFGIRNERFSAMTLSLAEHHLENHYKCIDIDNQGASAQPAADAVRKDFLK